MKEMIIGATYNPEYNFIKFSIAKRMQSELALSGNNKTIILTKDNKKIKFEIVIPMSCGELCTFFIH